jgi:signal transduction histidine kinase
MTARSVGLRTQILAVLLGVAILPLGLLGLWLTSSGVRSGEDLLRDHLNASADRYAAVVRGRWEHRRGDIALVTGNDATVRAVTRDSLAPADREFLNELGNGLARALPTIELRDLQGRLRWSSTPASRAAARERVQEPTGAAATGPTLRQRRPIVNETGARVGEATIDVALSAFAPGDSARPLVPGGQAAIRVSATQGVLVPLHPGVNYPVRDTTTVGTETWFVVHRTIDEPGIDVAIGAPLTPYVVRFRAAAMYGTATLVAVTIVAVIAALVLTRRMMRPLEGLAAASDAVTQGDLERRATTGGPTEVRRVGAAFNAMTENLRATLDELSRRNALAAVGEFATSLSHDVRNALTSIRVDLERAARRGITEPVADDLVDRALNNVSRLEATVTGAVQVARAGYAPPADLDLRDAVLAAAETVAGTFSAIPATLELALGDRAVPVRGSPTALQQVFANLLFNAAQALEPDGRAVVGAECGKDFVEITIADTGGGIDDAAMANLSRPYYSSKPDGHGLGLPIARRIVASHGGALTIESVPGKGTSVTVRLPTLNGSSSAIERVMPPVTTAPTTVAARNP